MAALAMQLNQRVRIEAPGTAQDEYGQPIPGWTLLVEVWASVNDLTAREFMAAAATQNQVQTKILIRARDGIAAKMRVVHGANIYNIEGILGQDNRTLLLMCSRGVNDG